MLALISHTLLLFKVLSCLQQFEIHSNWPEWWLNTFRFVLPGLAFALLSDYLRWFEYSNNSLLWCPCSAGGSSSTDLHFIIWSVLPWLLTCSEAFLCVLSVQIVLRAWKKKPSTSLGFFWRCFKTFLFPRCNKKKCGSFKLSANRWNNCETLPYLTIKWVTEVTWGKVWMGVATQGKASQDCTVDDW